MKKVFIDKKEIILVEYEDVNIVLDLMEEFQYSFYRKGVRNVF